MNARISRLIRKAARPYQQPQKHRALWKRMWLVTAWHERPAFRRQLHEWATVKITTS